jgi:putative PIG3 family NAD(P)H quinone oxidoreductase
MTNQSVEYVHIQHDGAAPLVLREGQRPVPQAGEVLIAVAAAGVNRPDLLQRAGLYPPPPGANKVLGLEVSGHVAALGAGVTGYKEGDAVCTLLNGGGYANFVTTPADRLMPVPAGLTLVEAAGLPETVLTVWANVFERAALQAGERFLVQGGASGIGTTAIQMACAQGARVFATAGNAEKCALCERLGAERAFNYKTEDYEETLRSLGGVDVVLDMVGGPNVAKHLGLLRDNGRLVQIAFLQGSLVQIDLMRLMLKRLTLTGSTLRSRPDAEKARLAKAAQQTVWPWIEAGLVRPVIDSVWPLAEAEAAIARMQLSEHAGKIILKVE